jgi:hypothetical protein
MTRSWVLVRLGRDLDKEDADEIRRWLRAGVLGEKLRLPKLLDDCLTGVLGAFEPAKGLVAACSRCTWVIEDLLGCNDPTEGLRPAVWAYGEAGWR